MQGCLSKKDLVQIRALESRTLPGFARIRPTEFVKFKSVADFYYDYVRIVSTVDSLVCFREFLST